MTPPLELGASMRRPELLGGCRGAFGGLFAQIRPPPPPPPMRYVTLGATLDSALLPLCARRLPRSQWRSPTERIKMNGLLARRAARDSARCSLSGVESRESRVGRRELSVREPAAGARENSARAASSAERAPVCGSKLTSREPRSSSRRQCHNEAAAN